MNTNVLYYGDNLDILRRYIPDESVDLIYLDRPSTQRELTSSGRQPPETWFPSVRPLGAGACREAPIVERICRDSGLYPFSQIPSSGSPSMIATLSTDTRTIRATRSTT